MKTRIEISDEVVNSLLGGKYIDGSLHFDEKTGMVVFNAWKRKSPKNPKSRVICYHDNGWLKESGNNLKFFTSVNKRVGAVRACKMMDEDLQYVTEVLFDKIENGEMDKDSIKLY